MKLTFTSKRLAERLQNAVNQSSGRVIAARITVPDDLKWWYFQEFGTATHFNKPVAGVPGGVNLPASKNPSGYDIPPSAGQGIKLPATAQYPQAAIFFWIGAPYTRQHPGVAPTAFLRKVLPDIDKQAADALAMSLLSSGFDMNVVKATLLEVVMPRTLGTIVNSMAQSLAQNRSDGKLGGQSPESVFAAAAQIIDRSS